MRKELILKNDSGTTGKNMASRKRFLTWYIKIQALIKRSIKLTTAICKTKSEHISLKTKAREDCENIIIVYTYV